MKSNRTEKKNIWSLGYFFYSEKASAPEGSGEFFTFFLKLRVFRLCLDKEVMIYFYLGS